MVECARPGCCSGQSLIDAAPRFTFSWQASVVGGAPSGGVAKRSLFAGGVGGGRAIQAASQLVQGSRV